MKIKFKDKRFIIFGIVLLISIILYAFRSQRPFFSYKLDMYEDIENINEKPLEIESYDSSSINFEMSFGGALEEYSKAEFRSDLRFFNYPPFFEYGRTLRVVVSNPKYKITEDRAVFSLHGTLYNLKIGEYKLRIEDSNKNLVDEITFLIDEDGLIDMNEIIVEELIEEGNTTPYDQVGEVWNDINLPEMPGEEAENIDPTKFCQIDKDCVAVGCGCSCSGCGGFSYEEIVNIKYQDVWYYERDCKPAEVCPHVCCEPAELKCIENVCKVIPTEQPLLN
jgi:hypothetical protein